MIKSIGVTDLSNKKFVVIIRTDYGVGINYLKDDEAKKLPKEKDFKNPIKMKFDGKLRTFYFVQLKGKKIKGALSINDIPKTWRPHAISAGIDFGMSKINF